MEKVNDSLICVCGRATPVEFSRPTLRVKASSLTVHCSRCRRPHVVSFSWEARRVLETRPLPDLRKVNEQASRELEAYEARRDARVVRAGAAADADEEPVRPRPEH